MPGDPVRIEQVDVTVPGHGSADGRRFGEAFARELQALLPAAAGGHVGRLDVRVHDGADAAAVARAVRDALDGRRR